MCRNVSNNYEITCVGDLHAHQVSFRVPVNVYVISLRDIRNSEYQLG